MKAPAPPPIPGLRTMAIVRWVLLAAVAMTALTTWWTYVLRPEPGGIGEPRFYCPMHPQIRSPQPGSCPICGMRLEPIPQHAEAEHDAGAAARPAPGEHPRGVIDVMLTTQRRQSVGIAVTPVSRRTVTENLRLPGTVEVPQGASSELRVRVPAYVEKVEEVATGAPVREGQPLAWVFAPELLKAQEEAAMSARWAQERSGQPPVPGQPSLETARRRLELLGVAREDIDELFKTGEARRLLPLRAPRSGVITRRAVNSGAYADPSQLLFEVSDLSRLWVTASASPQEATRIARGRRAACGSAAAPRMRSRFCSSSRASRPPPGSRGSGWVSKTRPACGPATSARSSCRCPLRIRCWFPATQ
ncbi:MAG: efflux RND transporter periplasmic adaptor subunit [Archangiaceae bacterium]|nr:efflux RND transporter periplasmic adaptor subunit [Archangiaceae bacterium]